MKKSILYLILLLGLLACSSSTTEVSSPDGKINLSFKLDESGAPGYSVSYTGEKILNRSALGFIFKNAGSFENGLVIENTNTRDVDENWTMPWGQDKNIRNNYNELKIFLSGKDGKELNLVFRLFNDGIGFRYEIPSQEGLDSVFIMDEKTEFNFAEDNKSWWIQADFDSYEKIHNVTQLSELDWASTPVTMRTANGTHLSVHEANLTDYSGMTLKKEKGSTKLNAELVPWPDGIKVKTKAPFVTPWRTIQISEKATDLLSSKLILNLNEPSKLKNADWIKPMKYIGIWWGMHLGINTWHMNGNHGATTENMKKYIDFAAEHKIDGVLAEGWNTGWENWGKPDAFDQITPYADYDLDAIAKYADNKGVALIGHHETGGDIYLYEKNLEAAMQLLHKHGIHSVKTGYAGGIPDGYTHHGQRMVQHYRNVVKMAAKYQVTVDAHEPIKPTGIRRTYPNMMTREGVRGMEWNAWSEGNPPAHTTIFPFTRGLAGPTDYTPGVFDLLFKNSKNKDRKIWSNQDDGSAKRVHTTLAKQLALMVVIYSPLQMACDLPENYEGHPALKFIEDYKADIDESIPLNGEIGEYLTIARRSGDEWFIGSITNENTRELEISLDFLDAGKNYLAEIYTDDETSDWKTNPYEYKIETKDVSKDTKIALKLAPGGGQAIFIKERK